MLRLFVVYKNPSDYPGKFVLRAWSVLPHIDPQPDAEPIVVADTIDEVRAHVPEWAIRTPRHNNADQAIAEVWL